MKHLIILLCLSVSVATITSDSFTGKYFKKFDTKQGNTFGFVLDIYKEGKFTLQCYRKIIDAKTPIEEVVYARGNWSTEGNYLVFESFKNDSSPGKKMIDITGLKALLKTTENSSTSLKFEDAKIPWFRGLELKKMQKH